MITKESTLSVVQQCKLLEISRSGLYYQHKPVSAQELELMRLLDEGHMKHPYYGNRRLRGWLGDHGHTLSRKKVVRLMRFYNMARRHQDLGDQTPDSAHHHRKWTNRHHELT